MTWNMRPLSVTILAWLYIGVGMIGFVSHFTEIHARNAFRYDGIWIEVVEVLAIVCGAFMLRHPLSVLCRDRLASFSSHRCAVFSR